MNREIKLPQANIIYREDGIIHIHYNDGLLSLNESKEVFYTTRENCEWEVAPIFLTGSTFSNQDKASRDFYGSEEVTKHCSAIAMLCNGLGQKLLANFFIKIIKPASPTRFFSSEIEAFEWLKNFKTINKTPEQLKQHYGSERQHQQPH